MQASRTKVDGEDAGKQDEKKSSADDESENSTSREKSLEEIIDTYSG